MTTVTRYFPWAPEIPWKMYHGKYLIPELTHATWSKAIEARDPIVVCNGGLLEAYFSLSYFELLNVNFHSKQLYWSGPSKYHSLIGINGLAYPLEEASLKNSTVARFPTPIFMDTVGNVYLNCLNDYMRYRSIYSTRERVNRNPLVKQIIKNSTQPWEEYYTPKFRNWGQVPQQIDQWAKFNRFNINKPFVIICPDRGLSMHKSSCLGWTEMEIKSLSAMLLQSGIQTLVFTDSIRRTPTSQAWFTRVNLDWLMFFSLSAAAILSEEIDLHLVCILHNTRSKLIGRKLKSPWNLRENARVFESQDVIYEIDKPTPYKVFELITEPHAR